MKNNIAAIERDIEHAHEMVELHYQQLKTWKQEVNRLNSDLLTAKRIMNALDAGKQEA